MATSPMNTVIRHLRKTVLVQDAAGMTDAQLLESFIVRKDEEAFEALLRRHGPMVLGVCCRVLHNHHDAEDAFQATFLVLARKAASVKPKEMVGNWLHGVAYRTALKANETTTKRKIRERQVTEMPDPQAEPKDPWHDLQPLLDEELSRLPENYRLPILLCDLEGKSIKEATQQLGWPQGTLAGRLARARKMLAKRLTQRGIVLSGGALAMALSEKGAAACVPTILASSTIKAAVAVATGGTAASAVISGKVTALMEGVLKGMLLTKLKTMAAVLLVLGMVAFGGGLVARHTATASQTSAEGSTEPAKRKPDSPKALDETKLHGEWVGKHAQIGDIILFFGANHSVHRLAESGHEFNGQSEGTYALDWSKNPHHLDIKWGKGPVSQTIMEFVRGGKLRIEDGGLDEGRPKVFTDEAVVFTKKDKPAAGSKQADADAARDLGIAEFYRRTGKFGSAHFYFELTRRRYPDTDHAKKAIQGLEDLKKHRFLRPDGSEGWETGDGNDKKVQPPPKVMHITPPQAERLLEQALGEKSDLAGLPVKLLSPSMFVASKNLVIEKDGRARLEPFRAILFGTDKNSQVTLVISERAVVTFDKPLEKLADLGSRSIVGTEFTGKTEMKIVNIENQEGGDKPKAKAKPKADAKEKPVARVGEIIVVGNERTPTTAILKILKIYPGEILDYQALRTAEKNLAAFRATVAVVESDTEFKDILITVKEK